MIIESIIFIVLCLASVNISFGVLISGVIFRQTWMEIGTVTVRFDAFVQVTGSVLNFTKAHVIMGPHRDGDYQINSGFQACTRLKNVKAGSATTAVRFQVRLTQPNDSWCNYTWWTPRVMPSQTLNYMIMKEGHYNVSGAEFDISSRLYNSHCVYLFYRHFWYSQFYNTKVRPCSIAQVQSYNDPRFITFREVATNINAIGVSLYMQLHNYDTKWRPRYGNCVNGHYLDLYDNNRWRQAYTMNYEIVSVFGYTPNYAATCEDGLAFESHFVDGITSDSRWVSFYWYYTSPPGVFGMINSFSGGDSITLRTFNYSLLGVGAILQEDQCDKQSVIHLQGERISFFVAGKADLTKGAFNPYTGIVKTPQSECCICQVGVNCENPSCRPSAAPTVNPTARPSVRPTRMPTVIPTVAPTVLPTALPTSSPTILPTTLPTTNPTVLPTVAPSIIPTTRPSTIPSTVPTFVPISSPTVLPTASPSARPTTRPSGQPTDQPTNQPSGQPTGQPTTQPTSQPTSQPTIQPTIQPTGQPSMQPTSQPTSQPSTQPTTQPTIQPTGQPTSQPTMQPTMQPTAQPSIQPTGQPTGQPSIQPTAQPTTAPTGQPSSQPTAQPTLQPSGQPTIQPTMQPTTQPTAQPSGQPSIQPTGEPTGQPSQQPTALPTTQPSSFPSSQPSSPPSGQPSSLPSGPPTAVPTSKPTLTPTSAPTANPSFIPTSSPTEVPTSEPSAEPTLSPTVVQLCPWFATSPGTYRTGNDFAVINGKSLGDCKNICLVQSFVAAQFDSNTLTCTLNFNLFELVVQNAATSALCSQSGESHRHQTCDSINWTPNALGADLGVCNLKSGRSGKPVLISAKDPSETWINQNTKTYDFNCLTSEPSTGPSAAPTIGYPPVCISFIMGDTFGDGWDSANLFIYDFKGHYDISTSSCPNNVKTEEYCFDTKTTPVGATVNATVFGFRPSNPWEVIWRAVIVNTGQVYVGTYQTWMTFTYNVSTAYPFAPYVTLTSANNLQPRRRPCKSCERGEAPNQYDGYNSYMDECPKEQVVVVTTEKPELPKKLEPAAVQRHHYNHKNHARNESSRGSWRNHSSTSSLEGTLWSNRSSLTGIVSTPFSLSTRPGLDDTTSQGSSEMGISSSFYDRFRAVTGSQAVKGSYSSNPTIVNAGSYSGSIRLNPYADVDSPTQMLSSDFLKEEKRELWSTYKVYDHYLDPYSGSYEYGPYEYEGYGLGHSRQGGSVIDVEATRDWTGREGPGEGETWNNTIGFSRQDDDIVVEGDSTDENSPNVEGYEGDRIDSTKSYSLRDYYFYGRDLDGDSNDQNGNYDANSWYNPQGYGSEAHISNIAGSDLYYTATLCSKDNYGQNFTGEAILGISSHSPCDLTALPRGRYMWRVTGILNPNKNYVAYDFCGVRGSYSTEIIFEIDCDGDCVPLRIRDLEEVCEAGGSSYVEESKERATPQLHRPDSSRPNGLEKDAVSNATGAESVETTDGENSVSWQGQWAAGCDSYLLGLMFRNKCRRNQDTMVLTLQGIVHIDTSAVGDGKMESFMDLGRDSPLSPPTLPSHDLGGKLQQKQEAQQKRFTSMSSLSSEEQNVITMALMQELAQSVSPVRTPARTKQLLKESVGSLAQEVEVVSSVLLRQRYSPHKDGSRHLSASAGLQHESDPKLPGRADVDLIGVHELTFRMYLDGEKYGVARRDAQSIETLREDLSEYLDFSMSHGLFRSRVLTEMRERRERSLSNPASIVFDSLSHLRTVTLQGGGLEVVRVSGGSFNGLIDDWRHDTAVNDVMAVFGVVLLLLLLGVLIVGVRQRMKSRIVTESLHPHYLQLNQTSHHDRLVATSEPSISS